MSTKFARETATALRLIKAKGVLLVFTRRTEGTLNPLTDSTGASTSITTSAWCVVLPPTTQTEQTYESQLSAGATKRTDVRRLLVSTSGVTFIPIESSTDSVKIGADTWSVLGGKMLDPDVSGTPIMAEVTIRR